MSEHTYVVSDVHLGGSASLPFGKSTVDFQMCPPESRRRLARFVHYLRDRHRDGCRLVINGDLVDFLAEESTVDTAPNGAASPQFEAFTTDPDRATTKLERIVERADEGAPDGERLFDALRAFLADGHPLHVLLGNHDLELTLPQVRQRLTSILTRDQPSRLEFGFDGEALSLPHVLVEHGNRYDGWNAVAYGQLRAARARASRGEPPYPFDPPPGSHLVVEVMNDLKARFRFIDLLKPETEAVIPVLTAIDRTVLSQVNKIFAASVMWRQWRQSITPGRVPERESFVAAGAGVAAAPALAPIPSLDREVAGDEADEASFRRTEAILKDQGARYATGPVTDTAVAAGARAAVDFGALRRALVDHAKAIGSSYRLDEELPAYLDAAKRLSRGGRTVIFGHTHLAKTIALDGGGTYINTGTWCPTIQVPPAFFEATVADGDVLEQVEEFVTDLRDNNLAGWRRLVTTVAHIDPVGTARLCEYRDSGDLVVMSE
jgi:UDP-2,3-diacylglucosamine pyrophosphatase LpxH